ncbi:MAG: serine/threonine protein kinase, partial [Bryobacterales bacterium]|nr:serine/threonine protein kinase [Bryobacterales bacterium]
MIGTTIGQYQILEKLGEGGMGVVYKARDTKLNRFVALKLLPPGTAGHRETRERFLNEARTASSLGHPNIVTIHDILDHDGSDVLVMEYIPGQTLEQILHTAGPLKAPEVIDYGGQIADALAAAHRAGLIHRDLKPGNIMITPEGRVKVVDFGL